MSHRFTFLQTVVSASFPLNAGVIYFLFTDGLLNLPLDFQKFLKLNPQNPTFSDATEAASYVYEKLRNFEGSNALADDITFMYFSVNL